MSSSPQRSEHVGLLLVVEVGPVLELDEVLVMTSIVVPPGSVAAVELVAVPVDSVVASLVPEAAVEPQPRAKSKLETTSRGRERTRGS
jgi:hypothetical protein